VNYLAGVVKMRTDTAHALSEISAEMSGNVATIERVHARHVKKCGVLRALAQRGRERRVSYTAYQNALDAVLPFAPPPLQATAWNLADVSGISANFDYGTRADIARVYGQQSNFDRLAGDLAVDFRPLVFTRDGDFFLVARNAALDCTDVTTGEERLVLAYHAETARLK
jgi:hypothetical protein